MYGNHYKLCVNLHQSQSGIVRYYTIIKKKKTILCFILQYVKEALELQTSNGNANVTGYFLVTFIYSKKGKKVYLIGLRHLSHSPSYLMIRLRVIVKKEQPIY